MPVKLPISRLRKHCDPFVNCPWHCAKITKEDVAKAITEKRFIDHPVKDVSSKMHIERIAWLVVNSWNDAIELDIGIPSMGCYVNWFVQDGNHRLAAAIYRRDKNILSGVTGSLEYALELFGVDCDERKAKRSIRISTRKVC
jgi:hypothetical protein